MDDSVSSVQMKLLPSRVIDCPQVECSASHFSGSCQLFNDKMFMLLCVFALSWDGYGIFSAMTVLFTTPISLSHCPFP